MLTVLLDAMLDLHRTAPTQISLGAGYAVFIVGSSLLSHVVKDEKTAKIAICLLLIFSAGLSLALLKSAPVDLNGLSELGIN